MTTINFEELEAVVLEIQIIRENLKDDEQKVVFDRFWKEFWGLVLEALPGLKYTSEMKAATDGEFMLILLMQAISLKSLPPWCPIKDKPNLDT